MISTSVLFGYLSYFKFFSVKKRFFLDSPKNWQISFQKNKKNIFLFFLFLCIQGIFSYYYGNILLRFILLILIGIWFFYIKKIPQVENYLKVLKQDDVTFKKHFKSKELRIVRNSFYFFIFLLVICSGSLIYILKFLSPIDIFDLENSENLKYTQRVSYLLNFIIFLIILTSLWYLGISIFIIFFCNDPIKAKLAQAGKHLTKFVVYGGLATYQGAHLYTGLTNTEPTSFSNIFDKQCFGGRGFGIQPGNSALKLKLYLCEDQTNLRKNLISFLKGSDLTDENFKDFISKYPQHKVDGITKSIWKNL